MINQSFKVSAIRKVAWRAMDLQPKARTNLANSIVSVNQPGKLV
jgi:hypothetical protein